MKKSVVTEKKSKNPAYNEAKKHEGKGEKDRAFVAYLSGYWKKAGLPGYKTIIGSSFAWCGLFILMANTNVGMKVISGAAGAKNWARYGQEIDFRRDGAPRGAVTYINHKGNCKSGSSNHVAFLDGDCTAADFARKDGRINLFGGNQSNTAKVSSFPAYEICEVRWPSELPLPGPVKISDGCSGAPKGGSTR
jgi:hypothetical protein